MHFAKHLVSFSKKKKKKKKKKMSSSLHLPSCLTIVDVYSLACDDLTQGNMQCCSISTFYDVWSKEFPHVQIPKVLQVSELILCTISS